MWKKNKSIHIPISSERLEALRKVAEKDRRKITAIIDIAIERYLKKRKINLN